MLRALVPVTGAIVFTRSRYRGADPRRLRRIWTSLGGDPEGAEVVSRPRDALARAREIAGTEGAVVVTGSTFVVDEALNPDDWLMEANAEYVPPGKAGPKKRPKKGL